MNILLDFTPLTDDLRVIFYADMGCVKGYQAVTSGTTSAYQRSSTVPLKHISTHLQIRFWYLRFKLLSLRHFSFPHSNLTSVWSLFFIASAKHVLCDSTTSLPLPEHTVFLNHQIQIQTQIQIWIQNYANTKNWVLAQPEHNVVFNHLSYHQDQLNIFAAHILFWYL